MCLSSLPHTALCISWPQEYVETRFPRSKFNKKKAKTMDEEDNDNEEDEKLPSTQTFMKALKDATSMPSKSRPTVTTQLEEEEEAAAATNNNRGS